MPQSIQQWTRRVATAIGVAAGALCVAAVAPLARLHAQVPLPDNVPRTPRPPAPGTSPALDSARAARGASLQVVMYTYGPGPEVFEKFGHIALAIEDAQMGSDIAFNWGMFDFNQPNFYTRFLTGDTKYWMAGYRTTEFNAFYQAQDRTIRQQRLNLTPMQRGALYDLVEWNAREENKYYRYDYYNDNCSTRVRDALDWVLSGALQQAFDSVDGHYTWRDETARITAENLPVYAGIQVALGRNADRHLTQWQLAFLPERFADALARTPVGGALLIAQDTVVYRSQSLPTLERVPQRTMPALIVGLLLGVVVFALARLSSVVLSAFGALWYGVTGVLGTALLLAGTVTKHIPYMGSNLNLTLFSPLLLLAGLFWLWRARDDAKGRSGRTLSGVVAAIALAGLVLEHLPGFSQGSIMVFMAVVPVHLALAVVANRRSVVRPSGAT